MLLFRSILFLVIIIKCDKSVRRSIDRCHTTYISNYLSSIYQCPIFKFHYHWILYTRISIGEYFISFSLISSNLFKLNICVKNFDDCFYLLDGRSPNLSTLHIRVYSIESSRSIIDHKVDDFQSTFISHTYSRRNFFI